MPGVSAMAIFNSGKGQAWYMDFFMATFIFAAALVYFFNSEINLLETDQNTMDELKREANMVADFLMSSGYPSGWEPSNVLEVGIVDKNRVNSTKLEYLADMNYNTSKSLLKTKYEYYLFFEDNNGVKWYDAGKEGIGRPGVNSTNIEEVSDPKHLIKVIRFVVYNSEPARMVAYLWAE